MTQGMQGVPGRPGAEGRPGTEGRAGTEGRPGAEGHTGQPGETGEPGKAGPEGKRGANQTHRLLIMFIFVVLALAFLSVRADHTSRQVQQYNHIACQRSNANSAAINGFLDLLIKFARVSTQLTPAEKMQRVTGYTDAKVEPLECG